MTIYTTTTATTAYNDDNDNKDSDKQHYLYNSTKATLI